MQRAKETLKYTQGDVVMYKIASNGKQAALDRGRLADWVTWKDDDTAEQKLKSAQLAVRNLDQRIQALPPDSEARKQLGVEKTALQNVLTLLRQEAHVERQDLSQFIIDVVRETLPPGQFKAIVAAARRRHRQFHDASKAVELNGAQPSHQAEAPSGVHPV